MRNGIRRSANVLIIISIECGSFGAGNARVVAAQWHEPPGPGLPGMAGQRHGPPVLDGHVTCLDRPCQQLALAKGAKVKNADIASLRRLTDFTPSRAAALGRCEEGSAAQSGQVIDDRLTGAAPPKEPGNTVTHQIGILAPFPGSRNTCRHIWGLVPVPA